MKSSFLLILLTSCVLGGILSSHASYADEEIQLISAADFDFSVTPFELWNGASSYRSPISGSTFEPLQLPELNSQTHSTSQLHTKRPMTTPELSFKSSEEKPSVGGFVKHSTNELAFADPIDFEIWRLVKWTLIVLVIAGAATYFIRFKQSPVLKLKSSRNLELIETLTIDPRTKVHLLSIGTEKYLIASDMNGVKSITLVPNWHVETEPDLQTTEDEQPTIETFLTKAS